MSIEKDKDGISVKCPKCGAFERLNGHAGWSFIIIRETFCKKCESSISHDDIIDE